MLALRVEDGRETGGGVLLRSEHYLHIPFNKPCLEGKELENMLEAVRRGKLAGDGHFTRACEAEIAESIGAEKVLLTHSGTGALELAALICDIGAGDEVIMPSFTFVSTANAFCLRGARPVFVDISPEDFNIDPECVKSAIGPRTKAIVPVHYGGVACNMDAINEMAHSHGIHVIEDAAHAYLGTYKGQPLGTIGDFGCFSFHETKTFICGEGGALVLNRREDIEKAEIMREKGTDRAKFFRGEVDKYTWVSLGSSFVMSELTAAFLHAQVTQRETIVHKREKIYRRYDLLLQPLVNAGLIDVPRIPEHCEFNYHMYPIVVKDLGVRTDLLEFLNRAGVCAVFHYVPLHRAPFAQALGMDAHLPVTEDVADRIIRLPFYNCMTLEEQEFVVDRLFRFFNVAQAHGKPWPLSDAAHQ